MARRVAVTIDGPTAAGKSTAARGVAKRLGYRYVDTGAMYRSVALMAARRGVDVTDGETLERLARSIVIDFVPNGAGDRVLVDGEDVTTAIRSPEMSTAASVVSTSPGVRAALVARQRVMAAEGGVVMEGRDIGTVVLPDAPVKIFLTATLEARVRRRHAELVARGERVTFEDVMRREDERDERDQNREHSPLRAAPDAVVIDTTSKGPDAVIDEIVRLVEERGRAW
jgi:cytidylate kinase